MDNLLILIAVSVVARLYWSRVASYVFIETYFVFGAYYIFKYYGDWENFGVNYHFVLGIKNVIVILILRRLIEDYEVLKFGYAIAAFLQLSIFIMYQFVNYETYYSIFLPVYNGYESTSMLITIIQLIGIIGGAMNGRYNHVDISIYRIIHKRHFNYFRFTEVNHRA